MVCKYNIDKKIISFLLFREEIKMIRLINEAVDLDAHRLENMIESVKKSIKIAKTFKNNYNEVIQSISELENMLRNLEEARKHFSH